ncbi:MAG: hypothetical protein KY454_02560 [Actinobacteria bacterium]|nr:hypothetical protein [Actinomycetota bacterium]MBW3650552.1 hypothetical protein [Actinomycetota bacterium]
MAQPVPGLTTASNPLTRALERDPGFRRDTGLGRIYHCGKASFRELSPTGSLHVIIDGSRVSAHIDRISPLRARDDGSIGYSWTRAAAHNLQGMADDGLRLLRGQRRRHRCRLECDLIWIDDDDAASGIDPEIIEGEMKIPFSVVDEAVHLIDSEAAPWSIQLEVRVPDRLDESRLRQAFSQAMARHDMARARKAPSRRSLHQDHWEIRPGTDIDPLRVVECPDDEALSAIRSELQSLPVPLAESPPLRARLARHPEGDVLMLNASHAAMDGYGALRVLRSVANAYAGDEDPAPQVGAADAREHLGRLTSAGRAIRIRRRLALAEKARDLVSRPARVAPDGATDEAGYGFHHLALSKSLTQALVGLDDDATVNDVLLASLHLAIGRWNEGHGKRCRRIGVLVPANLRPPQWRHDIVGNFSLPARVSTSVRHRRHRDAALRAVTAQTRRKKATGMGTGLLELLDHSRRLPLWAKQTLVMALPLSGDRLVDTAMLSNMGRLDEPVSFGADAGAVVEAWFSPPARMPLGLTVGAVTIDDRVHLAFRYRHRLLSGDAAARFAQLYLDEVAALVDQIESRHAADAPAGERAS